MSIVTTTDKVMECAAGSRGYTGLNVPSPVTVSETKCRDTRNVLLQPVAVRTEIWQRRQPGEEH